MKNEQMTSKERVLNAFSFKDVDRIPADYNGNSNIEARLLDYYNLKKGDREGLLKCLEIDFRNFDVSYRGEKLFSQEIPGIRVDPVWGIHTRWVEHESGSYWDYCDFPLKDADEKDIEQWPMPSPDDFNYDIVPEICEKYAKYALGYGRPGLGDIMNNTGMLFGMERVYMGMAMEDEALMAFVDRKLEIQIEITRRALEASQGGIDYVWIGEDLGTQRGPMISLDTYRKILKPRHQKLINVIKKYGLPVMIHSCGSSSWAFEDFIEMGINVVDTLQPEAVNMSPQFLKKKFGGRLAFHGCISTAGPLAYGSAEEVERNIMETIDIMAPGGGYCLAPTHSIQDNSPTENVVKMYETARKYKGRI